MMGHAALHKRVEPGQVPGQQVPQSFDCVHHLTLGLQLKVPVDKHANQVLSCVRGSYSRENMQCLQAGSLSDRKAI